ncbi:MAG: cyclic nucleotide-gated ion channel [Stappiaceae bacterium]
MRKNKTLNETRLRVYELLENGAPSDFWSRVTDLFLAFLIVGNAIAFALDTVEKIHEAWASYINIFTVFSGFVFTVEYVLRLWSSVEVFPGRHMPNWQKRLRFAVRPLQIVDILVLFTFWFATFVPYDLRVLRVVRLAVFFRMARYSPALQTLGAVLRAEWRSLTSALTIMLSLVLIAATGIYFIEGDVQPDKFGSVPMAAWWAIATLTTVGFGDVVPITPLGKMFGGVMMIFGLGMFALPIGIMATGFAQQSSQRNFVISWGLVARVPLFARLDNAALQQIVELMQSETITAGTVLLNPGDKVDRLIFIVDGELRVESAEASHLIGKGSFFGEMALLEKRAAKVTVTAHKDCRLLYLKDYDLSMLMKHREEIQSAVRAVARRRRRAGWGDSIDKPDQSEERE